jgi:hypothetical protein
MKRTFLAALLMNTTSTYAAQIEVGPPKGQSYYFMTFEDEIEPGDLNKFKRYADPLTGKVVISLTSTGGDLLEALGIGEYIAKHHWETYVIDYCLSSCALIWIAGTLRTMHSNAKIGFHLATLNGAEKGAAAGNALIGSYMTNLGLSYSAILWALGGEAEGMNYLTPAIAKRYDIDIQVFGPAPPPKQASVPAKPKPVPALKAKPKPMTVDQVASVMASVIVGNNACGIKAANNNPLEPALAKLGQKVG